ncbi:MAG: SPOR domain-containing protein [Treponema sp.]|jgi:DedD protein|nr:SPOR domain-containing protein [Treponema sp.]
MEKKKLLLVAVSVGVFLVIVMGAAILVLSPKSGTAVAAIERPIPPGVSFSNTPPGPVQPASADALDMTRNSGEVQGLETPPASFTASQENVFYFLGDNPDQVVQQTSDEEKNRVVIAVPKPAAAAVPDAPPVRPKPAAAPVRSAAVPAASPAPRTTAPAAAAPAKPKTEVRSDFWVQTGSFSTLVRADGVKETLASKGIASIIENRDVGGKTFYRVRIGPYTSQNEANYWLSLIKTIQGFEESQIWQSQSRR